MFFNKIVQFSYQFWTISKICFWFPEDTFYAGLSKLHSTCPKYYFEKNLFFGKLSIAYPFADLEKKFRILAKTSRKGRQNRLLCVHENHLREFINSETVDFFYKLRV